jgi:hypothetical protein
MRSIFYEAHLSSQQIASGFSCAFPRLEPMIKAFTEHPRSVGESYWQHMTVALSFAGALAWGALAALAHALFPFLCTRTASDVVTRLHGRMVAHRRRG